MNSLIGFSCSKFRSSRRFVIQHISCAVQAADTYSGSVEERAIQLCFFDGHTSGLFPNFIMLPVLDFLSVLSFAQSASQCAVSFPFSSVSMTNIMSLTCSNILLLVKLHSNPFVVFHSLS